MEEKWTTLSKVISHLFWAVHIQVFAFLVLFFKSCRLRPAKTKNAARGVHVPTGIELIGLVLMEHSSSQHLKQLHTLTHIWLQCLAQGTSKTQPTLKKKT